MAGFLDASNETENWFFPLDAVMVVVTFRLGWKVTMATIGAAGFGLLCMIGARVNSSIGGVLFESLQEEIPREMRMIRMRCNGFIMT
jgi:hypothetical protein